MNAEALQRSCSVLEAFGREQRTELLTIVFTDIADSAALKQQWGEHEAMVLVQRHHALIRELLRTFAGAKEVETAGDSFLLVFVQPSEAVKFVLQLQVRLRALAQETGKPVWDRVGVHVGEVFVQEQAGASKLFGSQVDVCARVMSLAMANQVLLTRFPFDNARRMLRAEDLAEIGTLSWLNHGLYLFKGVEEPMEVCEVRTGAQGPGTAPGSSEKAQRYTSPDAELVLGWRPAVDQLVPNTKWALQRKLGEGGFGEVWLGQHENLKEQRVFKFSFRADRVRSLKREVTLFRLLRERVGEHPNIVAIREVYFDEPPYYIAMDYVPSKDLEAWCNERGGVEKVPLETRLEIVAQVADGLQAAHDAGVLHRDIKPANILVAEARTSGAQPVGEAVRVRLTDFGIGQVVSTKDLSNTKLGFTQTLTPGTTPPGTTLYWAPELLAGKPASIRSDLFALGVVLYQLVVGDLSRPVTIDWARDLSDLMLREDLAGCLAGKPQERFAGAAQLARHLRSLEERRRAAIEKEAAAKALERAAFQRGLRRAALAVGPFVVLFLWWLWLNWPPPKVKVPESGSKGPNAFEFYQLAVSVLDTNALRQVESSLSQAPKELLQEVLQKNSNSWAALKMGFNYPCYRPASSPISMNADMLIGARHLSDLLLMQGSLDENRGRWNEAARHYVELIQLGTDLAVGSPIIEDMVAFGLSARGWMRLGELLPRLNADDTRELGRRLERIDQQYPSFARVLEVEKTQLAVELQRLFQRRNWRVETVLAQGGVLPALGSAESEVPWTEWAVAFLKGLPHSKRGVFLDILTYHDQWLTLARQPYQPEIVEPRFVGNSLTTYMVFTGLRKVWLQHLFVESQVRLLRVKLALHLYQIENNKLPSTLEDLVPAYLTALPADPFAPGSTLRYRVLSPEPLLYSVGPDGLDDGGMFPTNGRYFGLSNGVVLTLKDYRGDVGIALLPK